ncbi:MAG: oligosaccharide flippase family protein [Bdellovibrionales bacterium]|nr:oligosaccharide flippase family protein [Bdellovibrionales bacterium]
MRSNALYYALATVISNGIPFLVLPFLTRALTPSEFGIIALGQVFGTLTAGLSFQGLNIFFERNYFEWKKKKREKDLLFTFFSYCLFASILPLVILYFFPKFISKLVFDDPKLALVLVLFHIICSGNQLRSFFISYFRCQEDGRSFFLAQVIAVILSNALIGWWTIINHGDMYSYIYSHVTMNIIMVIGFALMIFKNHRKFDISFLKEALPVSLPLTPQIFIGTLSSHIDKYMLGLLGTLGGVGVYSVTQKFAFTVFIGMGTLGNLFTPIVYKKMFEGDSLKIRGEIGQILTRYFFVGAAFTLVLSLFSQELLILATAKEYHQSYSLIMILAFYYLLLFFGKQNQLVFKKRTYTISMLAFLRVGVGALLNYYFISAWGGLGAASATLVAGIIVEGYAFYLSQKAYSIVFEYTKILSLLAFILLSSIFILLAKELPYFQILTLKVFLLIVFAVVYRKNIIGLGIFFREKVA